MKLKKETFDLSDFHFEHKQWTRELEFWRDELKIFQHRLEEVTKRWKDKMIMARVEQFQNQFIRQNEIIDIYLHDIGQHEHELVKLALNNRMDEEPAQLSGHIEYRDKMETQRNIYQDLKKEFFSFLIRTR